MTINKFEKHGVEGHTLPIYVTTNEQNNNWRILYIRSKGER